MLGGAIAQAEVLRAARAQRALRSWPQVVGPGLASRSHPERYERGTVWVAVEGSAWAQELRMIKDVIIDRLEQHAGERGLFIDVRFGVRPLPDEEPEEETAKPVFAVVNDQRGHMSIEEIAAKRLRMWNDEGGTGA